MSPVETVAVLCALVALAFVVVEILWREPAALRELAVDSESFARRRVAVRPQAGAAESERTRTSLRHAATAGV